MVQNQKTPLQHNSTLFISPQVAGKRNDVFITPPNPQSNNLFESPGTLLSLFFNAENITGNLRNDSHHVPHQGDEPVSRVHKLRLWRHDALMQHQYKTAEYIGDKILSLTNDPNDAFWLAQVYFDTGDYLRANHLLSSKPAYEQLIGCRYLSAYSLVKLEQWDDALDILGETNPFQHDHNRNYKSKSSDYGVNFEASMCYLRGVIFATQNNFERAKEAYKEAVLVDVKCFEAFDELITNELLLPAEQWELIDQLNYSVVDDNDELIKLLYTSRLSKYMNVPRIHEAETILQDEYRLLDNSDLLLSTADYNFVQSNFDSCLEICEEILAKDPHNFSVLPNYLSCLYELGGRNKLFLKAHQLAESHPTNPFTWLAIGVYYLSIDKVVEARKYFSKATLLNPNSGSAWIGFAHTFAMEGEHEQAISAYAFAARLFPGNHLPNLFLGMQYLQMNNVNLAEEYLLASHHICSHDPLLLNELGVINYHKNDLARAEAYLEEALAAAKHLNSESKTWISVHCNLGHVYRKASDFEKALDCFNQALRLCHNNDSNILSSISLVYLKTGECFKAIDTLHNALAISPGDPVASDLLKRALEMNKEDFNWFAGDVGRKTGRIELPKSRARESLDRLLSSFHGDDVSPRIYTDGAQVHSSLKLEDEDPYAADVAATAERLKQGEESSDDEEVMDIE